MRRGAAMAWLGAIACIEAPIESVLEAPAGARTLVLILETKDGALVTQLRDLSAAPLVEPLTLQNGDAYFALYYAESIAVLGFEGLVLTDVSCPEGVPLRRLPKPSLATGRALDVRGLVTISDENVAALLGRVWRLEGHETGCAVGAWSRLDVVPDACPPAWAIDVEPPALPAPPQPPVACDGACPDPGFGSRLPCGPFEAHFLGSLGCEPIGGGCPSGDLWPPLPPGAFWVEAGRSGDGSFGSPSGDLPGIVAAAPSGATVAILGTLPLVSPLEIDRDLTIVGLCPERSGIVGTLHSHADLRLEHLALGGRGVGVQVPSGRLELDGVLLEGSPGSNRGIHAYGPASISIEGSVLRDWDTGVDVISRVTVTIARTNILGFAHGVTVNSTSSVELDQVALDARDRAPSELGWGVLALGGSTAGLRRAIIQGASTWGLITRRHSRLGASDVVIRNSTGGPASAIHVSEGTLTSTRVVVEGRFDSGVQLELNAHGRAVDLALDVHGRVGQLTALVLESGSRIEVERARLRSPTFGNGVKLGAGVLEQRLTDVEIDGVDSEAVEMGSGINTGDSQLIAKRLWIHDWTATGLDVKDGGALDLEDGIFERIGGSSMQFAPKAITSAIVVDRARAEDVGTALEFDTGDITATNLEIIRARRAFDRHLINPELRIAVSRFHAKFEEIGFSVGDPSIGPMSFSRGSVEAPSREAILRANDSCVDPRGLFDEVGTVITRD